MRLATDENGGMMMAQPHRHTRIAISTFAVVAIGLSACTDVDLMPVELEQIYERQHIVAQICAPEATAEDLPYKILFAIDTSLSNAWNDPDGHRVDAVRNAISSLIQTETVSFGIITFSDEPRRQTFGFTRDLDILDGAIENIGNAQGGTNYSDTLWEVIDFITDDLETLSAIEAARTHYLIYWLSDGFPTVGVTDTGALVPAVTYLMEQTADRVAEIAFNTAFLGTADDTNITEVEAATALLDDLADLGNGEFTSIPAGEEFEFTIELEAVPHRFELAYVVANNRHALFGPAAPEPDSDADGVPDSIEIDTGLDPTLADSDGDGFRDGIEVASQGALDPFQPDPGCDDAQLDSDGDGLSDCEESAVGTLTHDPDSDDDLVLDSMEVLIGTSPLLDDTTADADLDGISNLDELRSHLSPTLANDDEQVSAWAYQYHVAEQATFDCDNCFHRPPCYDLRVDNLTMTETLETSSHPTGGNVMELVVVFRSAGSVLFVRAQMRGRALLEADLWDPPGGRFELAQDDFVELSPVRDTPDEPPEIDDDPLLLPLDEALLDPRPSGLPNSAGDARIDARSFESDALLTSDPWVGGCRAASSPVPLALAALILVAWTRRLTTKRQTP
ncbi:VWA domain-containing protein [Myxococcota bacterium]